MEPLTLIGTIVTVLGFFYLVFIGQEPLMTWWKKRGKKELATDNAEVSSFEDSVLHNLPQPDYSRFVGRSDELKKIHQLLNPYPNSRHYLIAVYGVGGVGKSSLALETAHYYLRNYENLAEEKRFNAIIWISGQNAILTGDGIRPRRPKCNDMEDIFTTIARVFREESILRAGTEEQSHLVTNILSRNRVLLIIDNFETIDDDSVTSFLKELPDPTKAIITTRDRIDVAVPIPLSGMNPDEAKQLVQQLITEKRVELTDSEIERLCHRTGKIPLALVWCIGLISFGESVELVLARLANPHSHVAKYCFEAAVEKIKDSTAFPLLLALSLFEAPTDRETLGWIVGLSERILDRDEGLAKLEKLCLINKQDGLFEMLPMTREYVHSYFAKEPSRLKDFILRISEKDTYCAACAIKMFEGLTPIEVKRTVVANIVNNWILNAMAYGGGTGYVGYGSYIGSSYQYWTGMDYGALEIIGGEFVADELERRFDEIFKIDQGFVLSDTINYLTKVGRSKFLARKANTTETENIIKEIAQVPFIDYGAVDPITKSPLMADDSVVLCKHCGSFFLVTSWEYVNSITNTHGGIDNALPMSRSTSKEVPVQHISFGRVK